MHESLEMSTAAECPITQLNLLSWITRRLAGPSSQRGMLGDVLRELETRLGLSRATVVESQVVGTLSADSPQQDAEALAEHAGTTRKPRIPTSGTRRSDRGAISD